MTKKSKNTCIVVFAFICLLTIFLSGITFTKVSASNEVNYKKKIVSVVFDNSGSMGMVPSEEREQNARYSLQMLASMLGQDDELIVCPMNYGSPFAVDLTKENREQEIQQKIINNSVLNASGGTPAESIDVAITQLRHKGLKLSQELDNNAEQNVEYWLIMLTDGAFSGYDGQEKLTQLIEGKIKDYAGLNTIYLSFGSGAPDISSPDLSINRNYPFNAYIVKDPQKLVDSMKDVANKILGQYGAENNCFTVDGNKVIIDVDNFDFAMNSITIIAQNCGAEITSAKLNGKDITPKLCSKLQNCGLSIDAGYIAVIKDTTYMASGELEIVFNKPISEQSISILVEPALFIEAELKYFDGTSWKTTDMQYINSNMMPGDKIKVEYKVYSSADRKEVDIKTIFSNGEHIEKVTYCGQGYAIGDEITLKEGANEIYVSIVISEISYTMKTSLTCYIEKNPTYYRIESQINNLGNKKSQIVYKVFANNQQISYSDFAKYKLTITAKDPNGTEFNVSEELRSDGKVYVEFDGTGKTYGSYTFNAKVTSNETNVSRSRSDIIQIVPNDIQVDCLTTETFSTTEFLLDENQKKVEFGLKLEGNDETFERDVVNYTVTLNGKDVKDSCSIQDGKLVFTISRDSIGEVKVGNYQLKVNVFAMGGVSDQAQYDFSITDSVFAILPLDKGTNEFDRYHASDAGAGLYFAVYKDNKPLTAEQIKKEMDSGNLVIEIDPSGWITMLPCAVDISVKEENGLAFIACKVYSDTSRLMNNLMGSFIFDNEETVIVKINNVSCSGNFIITQVSLASRIIRWIIILLIILFIIHLLLFALGFIIAKPLLRGKLLRVDVDEFMMTDPVTLKDFTLNLKKEIFLWHLSRFIPFRELKDQKPKILNRDLIFDVDKKTRAAVCKFNAKKKSTKCLVEYNSSAITVNPKAKELKDLVTMCRKGRKVPRELKLTKNEFMKFFKETRKSIRKEETIKLTTWYGVHVINDDETIGERLCFYVFIPKTQK